MKKTVSKKMAKKTSHKPIKKPLTKPTSATKKQRPVKENSTVYVSNLNYKRDKQGIRNLFSRYGTIKNINIVIDFETKQSKGMAFVEMGSIEEAKNAIAGLNAQEIDGRTLKASFAIPQESLTVKLKDTAEAPKKVFKSKPKLLEKKTDKKIEKRPLKKPHQK